MRVDPVPFVAVDRVVCYFSSVVSKRVESIILCKTNCVYGTDIRERVRQDKVERLG